MKKYKALVTAEVCKDKLKQYREIDFEFDGYNINHIVMNKRDLIKKIVDKDILICEYDTIDSDIMDAAKKLKLIICCRGGYKSVIDMESAKRKKIMVCNMAGRNANAVSDMVIGYIIDMTRNLTLTNNLIHNKIITSDVSTKPFEYKDTVWGLDESSPFIKYRGDSINHMTLGLIGYGRVGKLVSKKAKCFGLKVYAYDPYVDKNKCPKYVSFVELDQLLKKSNIVSLHCNVNSDNKYMCNADFFEKMQKNSYFINTSRGELVVEEELIKNLKNNKLKGAAIDVTIKEPISSNSDLLTTNKLIITPHIGGSSLDVQIEGTKILVKTLNDWLKNKVPTNCISEEFK